MTKRPQDQQLDPQLTDNWIQHSPTEPARPGVPAAWFSELPLAVPTQDEPVRPDMGGRVRVVCRRCCTQIQMICTVAALAEFETAAIPNGGSVSVLPGLPSHSV
jgi:hypothetical protein